MTNSLEVISNRRSRLGISQADLCRRADVSQGTLIRARKRGSDPTPRILRKLNQALDVIAHERGVAIVGEVCAHE